MAETTNEQAGRASYLRLDYNDEYLILEVEGLARDGYDDYQIADILGVARETFSKAKHKRAAKTPENPTGKSNVYLALARGRRPLSVMVENSLYRRANGQTVKTRTTTTRFLVLPDGTQTETQIVSVTEIETELPGDYNSMNLWLRAHKPEMYNLTPAGLDPAELMPKRIESDTSKRITTIEHVTISDREVTKVDVDV